MGESSWFWALRKCLARLDAARNIVNPDFYPPSSGEPFRRLLSRSRKKNGGAPYYYYYPRSLDVLHARSIVNPDFVPPSREESRKNRGGFEPLKCVDDVRFFKMYPKVTYYYYRGLLEDPFHARTPIFHPPSLQEYVRRINKFRNSGGFDPSKWVPDDSMAQTFPELHPPSIMVNRYLDPPSPNREEYKARKKSLDRKRRRYAERLSNKDFWNRTNPTFWEKDRASAKPSNPDAKKNG